MVGDSDINAFALPGGFVGVNAGLVTATRNESELAGVLAHEISHVTQRHIARSRQNAGRANLVSTAAMLAAILIGATTGMPGDATMGAMTAAQGLAAQQPDQLHARERGRGGPRRHRHPGCRAGSTRCGMPAFFGTMQQRRSSGRKVPDLLRTHPVTSERIAETRDRARSIRGRRAMTTARAMRSSASGSRLQSLPAEPIPATLYRMRRVADVPVERRRACTATRSRSMQADAADRGDPGPASLLRNAARTSCSTTRRSGRRSLAAGRADERARRSKTRCGLSPRNVPVTIRYAEALLRAGDPKRAHDVLLDLFNNVPPTPEQMRLTAIAANAAGDVADAYSYMAEYHVMSGDLALAINQLKLALSVPGINDVQRARFDARIQELEEYCRRASSARDVAGPRNPRAGPTAAAPARIPRAWTAVTEIAA